MRPVRVDEFDRIKKDVQLLMPDSLEAGVGALFGPVEGELFGDQFPTFVWASWWTLLVKQSDVETLKSHGAIMPSMVQARLTSAPETPPFLECELWPAVSLANDAFSGTDAHYCHI
jgi:hypothetical protein